MRAFRVGVVAITMSLTLACANPPSGPAVGNIPQASLASTATVVIGQATGSAHWTIPLPNPFDEVIWNRTLSFNARKYADGTVSGHQVASAEGTFISSVYVTCLGLYDGNRAKIGGVIVESNDPSLPAGVLAWF